MESKLPPERYTLEIFLAGRNLINMDLFSKSDPFCIVSYQLEGEQASQLGQTEVIDDNLNPSWEKTFIIDYYEELQQKLIFEVFDKDHKSGNIASLNRIVELIGAATCTVQEILSTNGFKIEMPLKNEKEKVTGKLLVKIDKQVEPSTFIFFGWRGINLQKQIFPLKIVSTDGFFGKSDPFLIFYKWTEGDVWLQAHKTDIIKENLNPQWNAIEISTVKLCNMDEKQKFKVQCWDHHSKENKSMGEFIATVDEIAQKKTDFELKLKNGKGVGHLQVYDFRKIFRPTFRDYLKDGEQINLMLGIDYSLKNGDANFPDSLHQNGNVLNHYELAIQGILQVLLPFDFDKFVPVYGFAAIPLLPSLKQDQASYCFPLTGDFKKPEVPGQEVMKLYKNTVNQMEFTNYIAPSKLCDLVNYSKMIADANAQKKIYSVLVILTYGEAEDIVELTNVISQCARSPISFIIVKIGKQDVDNFKNLDKVQKSKQSIDPARSLVTFIEFEQVGHNPGLLKKALLSEFPRQLCYFKQLTGQKPSFAQ